MKPYFSVDIESTGLDRQKDQILELAVLYEEPEKKLPLNKIPKFHCIIHYPEYRGSSAYAIALNKRIFDELAKHSSKRLSSIPVYSLEYAIRFFCNFVEDQAIVKVDHTFNRDEVRFTGKNFAAFDLQFLQRDGIDDHIKYNHRYLDVGSMFFNPKTMDWIPSSSEVYKLAGIDGEVAHTAVDDAYKLIEVLRSTY